MKLAMVARLVFAACLAVPVAPLARASAPALAPTGQALEKQLPEASTTMPEVTAEQTAKYRTEYLTAKAKRASPTPQRKQATVAAVKATKLAGLSAVELAGQRDETHVLPG